MSYSKRNLLKKIIEIQNIVIKEHKRGLSQKWIFENFIEKVYFISYSTFNCYMSRNAKKELCDMDEFSVKNDRQLKIFD
jgi:hypothetical protein